MYIPERECHDDIPREIKSLETTEESLIHIAKFRFFLFHAIERDRVLLHDLAEISLSHDICISHLFSIEARDLARILYEDIIREA